MRGWTRSFQELITKEPRLVTCLPVFAVSVLVSCRGARRPLPVLSGTHAPSYRTWAKIQEARPTTHWVP